MLVRIKLLIFVVSVSCLTNVMAQQYIPKFDVQGHRGAQGLAPQNTIPAFLTALEYGVTTLQLDVVITADKQVVVSNEPWIDSSICLDKDGTAIQKTDERALYIYKMTYEELAKYDCGSKPSKEFPLQKLSSQRKPLLKDVIVAVENYIRSYSQYEVDYNIEIRSGKSGDDKFHPGPEEFSDLVFNLVNQYLPLNRVVIQSLDTRILKYWHKKYPSVRIALKVENSRSVSRNISELGFNPSAYCMPYKSVSGPIIQYLHARKIRVIPWTVNEPATINKLKAWGVDGVITDYPDRTFQLGLGVRKSENGKANGRASRKN